MSSIEERDGIVRAASLRGSHERFGLRRDGEPGFRRAYLAPMSSMPHGPARESRDGLVVQKCTKADGGKAIQKLEDEKWWLR